MRPFPAGPATRSALYLLGLIAALKALSLVLMAQAVASMLAGLAAHDPAWADQLVLGAAGAVLRSLTVWAQSVASRRAALGVKEELRSQLLEQALRNGTRSAGPADGGLAVLATRGLDALDNYYTQFLPALVNCAAIPLLLGARILFADWISAVVIVLTVPLVPLFMILIGRYTEERVRDAQSALARPRPTRTGRPLASSSMCPESRASADWASLTRSSVYRPIRIMNSGTSGTVSTITTALTQSANRMRAPSSSGMAAQFTSAGRNWV